MGAMAGCSARLLRKGYKLSDSVPTIDRDAAGTFNWRPLEDRVVIAAFEGDDQTPGGILLPESARERPQMGRVVAVGKGRRGAGGQLIEMDVTINDTVMYAKYTGTAIRMNGKELLILKESDILLIATPDIGDGTAGA